MDQSKTVKQLNQFVDRVRELGIEVRHELLDGVGAGICEVHGNTCLFLDVSCGPAEQLDAIRDALPALETAGEKTTS